eukprot:CAMPEP_0180686144 /NCGR_PEP_ID=MMETSP1037_2-20121125/72781_1 /TAXON_ID=632150 /ORGANISM="Azadinium spinosum, Strain 3D9" /LENGTH=74 /DNA_ID=CAMNT_0022716879 /DNA_START=653 /DNA_END=874 /DNA_ORIENTATION=+
MSRGEQGRQGVGDARRSQGPSDEHGGASILPVSKSPIDPVVGADCSQQRRLHDAPFLLLLLRLPHRLAAAPPLS